MGRFGLERDRLAACVAILTLAILALTLTQGNKVLMPGPLSSAHSTIKTCSTCHVASEGNLGWLQGLLPGELHADSKACLTCHKMTDTAFNAHGTSEAALKASTERLILGAASVPRPLSARAQSAAFPTTAMMAQGLECATCHKEHGRAAHDLKSISNEQCRSCHVVQFDAFDGNHPKFAGYPAKRRTAIIFDHAGHFEKHFPDVLKKTPSKATPQTCSSCHDSRKDRSIMSVLAFERTCAGCHLDQITGKERVSGPKGVPFLSLPGLDLQTLKKRNIAIGEWPEASDAQLSPFMKVLIGGSEPVRGVIKAVEGLNLQDLSQATDAQLAAVGDLAWQIKLLFSALIKGKVLDAFPNLKAPANSTLDPSLVAELTASLPRDVIISAQQEWLPGLGNEIKARATNGAPPSKAPQDISKPGSPPAKAGSQTLWRGPSRPLAEPSLTFVSASGGDRLAQNAEDDPAITKRWTLPSGTPRAIDRERGGDEIETQEKPGAANAPSRTAPATAKPPKAAEGPPSSPATQPEASAGEQTDDLLLPSESELQAIKSGSPAPSGSSPAGTVAPRTAAPAASEPSRPAAAAPDSVNLGVAVKKPAEPVLRLDTDLDAESWAEGGGWYRQDFTIYYRPTGHKDKFIASWLTLTGALVSAGTADPAAAVFAALTNKDAQGSCTKCHSIDDVQGGGRAVVFSPRTALSKRGEFTRFVHEPHFGVIDERGCASCHILGPDRTYLKSYEQGNPRQFKSKFEDIRIETCRTCHSRTKVRQDCLTCHRYHVNGVSAPPINARIGAH